MTTGSNGGPRTVLAVLIFRSHHLLKDFFSHFQQTDSNIASLTSKARKSHL